MENRDTQRSALERLLEAAAVRAREDRAPLIAGLLAGLLAHGYAFVNKLPNADDIGATFSKGGGADVGRWLIEGTRLLFPDVSMPWVYGLISLVLFVIASCVILRLLAVQNRCLQAVFAACAAAFPALTGLYCYMFTAAPYALAFLLAVLSVAWFCRGTHAWRLAGCAALALSLGIYQAYLAAAAGLYLLLMIRRLLKEEDSARAVLLFGLRALGFMLISLLAYYLFSRLVLTLEGNSYVNYGVEGRGLLHRVALAYNAFLKTFTRGYFGYINSGLSLALHLALLAFLAVFFGLRFIRSRDWARSALLFLCLLLLPLALNCMFLAADAEIIHSLVLHSFVLFYALALLAADCAQGRAALWARDLVLACLIAVTLGNVYFANRVYFKMFLQYEAAYSFYTELLARVEGGEGYDGNSRLALVGFSEDPVYSPEELDIGSLAGPSESLVNIYTRQTFLRCYLGSTIPFATADEHRAMYRDERVKAMPCYPYDGSIRKFGDLIVVRLNY